MSDPDGLSKHLLNGSPSTYFPSNSQSLGRQSSEPPFLSSQSRLSPLAPILSKDDTYIVVDREGNGRSPSKTLGPTHTSRPYFDPRQLLDPKGYNTIHRKKELDSFVDVSKPPPLPQTSDLAYGSQKRSQNESEGHGMGNMIERVYNITERQERPRKKQKTDKDDDGEENGKASFSGGGGKGGEIGEYMKQKREEGQKDLGPPKAIIDLTEGESYPGLRHTI